MPLNLKTIFLQGLLQREFLSSEKAYGMGCLWAFLWTVRNPGKADAPEVLSKCSCVHIDSKETHTEASSYVHSVTGRSHLAELGIVCNTFIMWKYSTVQISTHDFSPVQFSTVGGLWCWQRDSSSDLANVLNRSLPNIAPSNKHTIHHYEEAIFCSLSMRVVMYDELTSPIG